MKKKISIVTPVYNEEEGLHHYHERMSKVLKSLEGKYDFEIIFTDNCSSDKSFQIISDLAKSDSRIKAYSFSKNFGYQKSILTGYKKATGDAAIEFDCDLQDPPELLPRFIEEWEKGKEIVYGVRTSRPEGVIVTNLRKLFYRLIRSISENDLPADAGDFMLIDRKILNHLREVRDQNLYLRGLIFSYGYRQIGIEYSREARQNGVSKFPIRKMLALAIDGIVSQSTVPLRVSSYVGLIIAVLTALLSGFYLALKLVFKAELPAGFTTTVLLILFSISLNAIFLGIIGEYLGRIYMQGKNLPVTIIRSEVE